MSHGGQRDVVAATLAAGRAAWPAVRLAPEVLARHLAALAGGDFEPDGARVGDGDGGGGAPLADRRLADLYLACACLAGDGAALRALDELVAAEARRAVAALGQPAHLADEVRQELGQRLLVSDDDAPPRLARYGGQAVLGRWLGVAATRLALNLVRGVRREAELDSEALAALPAEARDPAIELVRQRYRADFEAAIREAFAELEGPRDRNLLRLYYFDGVGLDRLGQLFGVHGSTVSRWLTALRAQILQETMRRLAARLELADSDVASVLRLVQSDLDLTLSRILKASA
jgi:RNA polymerase sigma-70 factor, ECF subfamily